MPTIEFPCKSPESTLAKPTYTLWATIVLLWYPRFKHLEPASGRSYYAWEVGSASSTANADDPRAAHIFPNPNPNPDLLAPLSGLKVRRQGTRERPKETLIARSFSRAGGPHSKLP